MHADMWPVPGHSIARTATRFAKPMPVCFATLLRPGGASGGQENCRCQNLFDGRPEQGRLKSTLKTMKCKRTFLRPPMATALITKLKYAIPKMKLILCSVSVTTPVFGFYRS